MVPRAFLAWLCCLAAAACPAVASSAPRPALDAPASPHAPGSVPAAAPKAAAPKDLWSLRPVQSPPLPPAARDGATHLVDRFLDARMAASGLRPAPEAPREAILRRLAYVLAGIPPTPEQTRAFVADTSPDAWERAVDRFLASPEFGERWARHWMDVVRYGESHGSQGDPELPMAWRYRDYLVRAFNQDVPYDQFVLEHVAGDLLPSPRINPVTQLKESAIGTAHLRMVELGYIPVDALDDQVKVVDSQVDVLSKAFLALTVSCARCHDHKFDPISQRDFHAWYGILASGRPGQVVVDAPGRDDEALAQLATAKTRLRQGLAEAWDAAAGRIADQWPAGARAEREREDVERAWQASVAARNGIEAAARKAWRERTGPSAASPSPPTLPRPVARWTFESGLGDDLGAMHGRAEAGAVVRNGRLRIPGGEAHVVTAPLGVDLRAMSLEAWVSLDNLTQRGGGVLTVQTPDSQVFDSIVFGERDPGRWIAGSDFFRRTRDVGGPEESARPGQLVHMVVTHAEDGTIALYRDGVAYGSPYQPGALHVYRAGKDRVVLGRRHLTAGVQAFSGEVEEARLYDRALSPDEVSASFKAGFEQVSEKDLVASMSPADKARREGFMGEASRLAARLDALRREAPGDAPLALALAEATKDPGHALHPWAMLRHAAGERFQESWPALWAAQRTNIEARLAFNRSRFTQGRDLLQASATRPASSPPPAGVTPAGAGEFIVEAAGDRIVSQLLPAGLLSPTLTRKKPGVLLSPRFKITSSNVSVRALGSHANVRVVIENYPIGNGGIYPARGLDREAPAWLRLDTSYRIGSHAHLEVVTAEDFPSPGFRSGPRPYAEGRASFAVTGLVFHDGPDVPRETLWPWRGLAAGSAPASVQDLARAYARLASQAVQRWRDHAADEDDVALLNALVEAGVLPVTLQALPALATDVERFRATESAIPVPTRAPGLHEVPGEDFPLFQRGDPNRPGPPVPRGFLSALGGKAYQPAGSGRLDLARDLASPTNPLVARVMVNRIWHHVFGRGLVPTPDNFGRLGVAPTHPELLDALAIRFVREGWSVRGMARLLVTSAAFKRSTLPPEGAASVDPANDLLSHARVRRLDAEALRDALLAVSSQLDRRMGGPGVDVYYTGKTEGGGPSGPLDGARRRSVYQRVRRNAHNPFLEAFDAPKPSSPRGARDVTNVPAQALAMLNDPFVREMASRWAARLVASPEPRRARVELMLATALGRSATEAEIGAFLGHFDDLARDHGVPGEMADRHAPAWADLAQSLFCLKEFLYVH